jgi:hemolysin activation/secretion protein
MVPQSKIWAAAFFWCAVLAGTAFFSGFFTPALAQQSSEPSHVDERFRPQPPPPSVGTPIEIPQSQAAPAHGAAGGVPFTLSSVDFQGNTVLPNSTLQALAAPYIGRQVTLDQVYELADRVTAAYRDAGYILTRAIVPAQRVSNGHITLKIVEGFIDQVKIQGDAGGARSYLQAYGWRIARVRPLTADVLERQLLLASDLTGYSVRSVLTPSTTVQGGADLTLVVDHKPFDFFVGADNRGSKYLGPYEVLAGVFFNDPFGTGGRLGLNGVVTPDRGPELGYGAISFDQPIGTNGLRLFSSVSYTNTLPGSILRELDTKGRALNGDVSVSFPFIRSRDFNLSTSLSFGYHDVHSQNIVISPLFSDHIRSLTASVYVNGLDDWGGYSTGTASVTQGLDILGATEKGSPDASRAGAGGSYTRANFEITHEQPLFDPVSLFLAGTGQTSFGSPLLASEQFSLGGLAYDRAFDPSEVTGDSALAGRAELRVDAIEHADFISNVQPYGFYEGGEVWESKALPGTPEHETLTSVGAGIRFNLGDQFNADLEWAKPLERQELAFGNKDSRFFFSVGANF